MTGPPKNQVSPENPLRANRLNGKVRKKSLIHVRVGIHAMKNHPLNGNLRSDDQQSGDRQNGNLRNEDQLSGDRQNSNLRSGDQLSGDHQNGNLRSGDQLSGDRQNGNLRNAGHRRSGPLSEQMKASTVPEKRKAGQKGTLPEMRSVLQKEATQKGLTIPLTLNQNEIQIYGNAGAMQQV